MARGSIKQRTKGSWFIRVELEPDPATGKRKQKAETFVGNKHGAEDRLAELLNAARQGAIGNAGRLTVADFLDQWLKEHATPNLAPKTSLRYRHLVDSQLKPVIGRIALEKLRPSHILQLKTALREMPRKRRARRGAQVDENAPAVPISSLTQRNAYRVLHTALEHAVKWRLIPTNPAASVAPPSAKAAEMHTFTPEQAAAFAAAAHVQGVHWHAFFSTALNTGMRLAELVGLRWQDVDLHTGVVRVRQTIAHVPTRGTVVKAPKTAAGRRSIPIGADLVALLKRHKATQNEERLQLGSEWRDHDLVFPSSLGTPVQEYLVRKVFARICSVADVPVIRIHDLRHTAATLMLLGGINAKVVSERLGHANIGITLQTYSHVLPTMQQDAANVLEAMLRGASAATVGA